MSLGRFYRQQCRWDGSIDNDVRFQTYVNPVLRGKGVAGKMMEVVGNRARLIADARRYRGEIPDPDQGALCSAAENRRYRILVDRLWPSGLHQEDRGEMFGYMVNTKKQGGTVLS